MNNVSSYMCRLELFLFSCRCFLRRVVCHTFLLCRVHLSWGSISMCNPLCPLIWGDMGMVCSLPSSLSKPQFVKDIGLMIMIKIFCEYDPPKKFRIICELKPQNFHIIIIMIKDFVCYEIKRLKAYKDQSMWSCFLLLQQWDLQSQSLFKI